MSLVVYSHDPFSSKPKDIGIIEDVDEAFAGLHLPKDEVVVNVLRKLEQAEYHSPSTFTDRFGITRAAEFMSTGCKAILLAHLQDRCVDFMECGVNAMEVAIQFLTRGTIIIPEMSLISVFELEDEDVVDVVMEGVHYNVFGVLGPASLEV